jgi:hypothetical protein
MAGVLDLRDVFQLVIDGLDDRAFTQQQLVKQRQQLVFHILTQLGNQLHTLLPELCKECLGNVAPVAVPAATLGDAVGTPSPVSKRPAANLGFPFGISSLIGCLLRTGFLLCPLLSVNGQLHIDPCPKLLRGYDFHREHPI